MAENDKPEPDDFSGEYIDDNVHAVKEEPGLQHEYNEFCWCDPEVTELEDGSFLVQHRWRH